MNQETQKFYSELLQGKHTLLKSGLENAKLAKNSTESWILNLAPHESAGMGNVCPYATEGCIKGCLNTSGFARFKPAQNRRKMLTEIFFNYRKQFLIKLQQELEGLNEKGKLENKQITIRLNGTSDLNWVSLIKAHTKTDILDYHNLQFMDYTKSYPMWLTYKDTRYHLTFSRAEDNWDDCERVLNQGGNVAVVFYPDIPETYNGYKIISGDTHDERFLDPKGVIVGLKYKRVVGNQVDTNDFIVKTDEEHK